MLRTKIAIAVGPPRFIKNAIVPHPTNAINAVKNHPPITFKTPATLYTALSLPHALSASDVPIAT